MPVIAYVAIGLLVAILVLRFVFPAQLVGFLIAVTRRVCGLRTRSVEVDGISWPYLEGGNPSNDTLILVHGFGGDKDNWPLYARQLRKDVRVIVPDLPGFGENDKNPDADYSVAAQAERLAKFASALGIERFHVAGNSMGGYIALQFSLRYPERLLSLTLLNNAGVSSVNKSEVEVAANRGENILVVNSVDDFRRLLKMVSHKPVPFPGIIIDHIGKKATEHRDFWDPIFWNLFEDITQRPLDDRLGEVKTPTLIVWGREDRILDVSCTELMKERIPDNSCVVFDDVGHVPMIECPAATAAAHRELISRSCVSSS